MECDKANHSIQLVRVTRYGILSELWGTFCTVKGTELKDLGKNSIRNASYGRIRVMEGTSYGHFTVVYNRSINWLNKNHNESK